MPRMSIPPCSILACVLSAITSFAEAEENAQPLYSESQYSELYERAAARIPPPETDYISEVDAEPLIELEPFIVNGDNTLLLARIRRQLELGPASIRRRVAELSPMLDRQAQFSGHASERFFLEDRPGSPRDVSGVGRLDFREAISLIGKGVDALAKPD